VIPKECRRLIEVDCSIAIVSKHSAREKSIPQGHPTSLRGGGMGIMPMIHGLEARATSAKVLVRL
jgi:hypothetical protein